MDKDKGRSSRLMIQVVKLFSRLYLDKVFESQKRWWMSPRSKRWKTNSPNEGLKNIPYDGLQSSSRSQRQMAPKSEKKITRSPTAGCAIWRRSKEQTFQSQQWLKKRVWGLAPSEALVTAAEEQAPTGGWVRQVPWANQTCTARSSEDGQDIRQTPSSPEKWTKAEWLTATVWTSVKPKLSVSRGRRCLLE